MKGTYRKLRELLKGIWFSQVEVDMGSGNLPEGVELKLKYEVYMGSKWIIGEGRGFQEQYVWEPWGQETACS